MAETDQARHEARRETEAVRLEAERAAEESTQAGRKAAEAGRPAGRTARVVLAESAYVTLGVGGLAVDLARQAPSALRSLNRRTATGAKVVRNQVARGFGDLSRRGHQLVGSASLEARRAGTEARPASAHATQEPKLSATPGDVEPAQGAADAVVETAELEQLTVGELRERARAMQIEGCSTMNKQELVAALRGRP